ncbi:MAG: hypothetical protein KF760_20210 [Candidatus Eremiobacteraeota bacterium]|nr:hypothetical protein [Candidatus Eremiobacteraeota bacterium]MCW5868157.1 hypothetical protein [Candidatus Eremiobacteraeota bacterium]
MSRNYAGLLLAIALTGWAGADPKLGVDVRKTSDRVELRLSQDKPFENVSQKWRENPHRLEITIPKVEWQGKAVSNIDKGVLQKVEVKPGAGNVVVTLYALQNPKMSWISSPDKKNWTLRISAGELASGNDTPRLPVASKPAAAPGLATLPPVKPTATPDRPAPRPVTPTPAPARNNVDQRPITVSFINKDLPAAIREMAQAAGLEADIGPGVKGSVTASFKDTPLSQALTNVLGKQQDLYEVKIEGNRVRVFGDNSGAGATLVPTITHPDPVSEGGTRSLNLVSDYFPLMADKSASQMVSAIRRAVSEVEVIHDDRLNVLFVRGEAGDLEKVRNLLQNVLAK